jgi:hypothetical protein
MRTRSLAELAFLRKRRGISAEARMKFKASLSSVSSALSSVVRLRVDIHDRASRAAERGERA